MGLLERLTVLECVVVVVGLQEEVGLKDWVGVRELEAVGEGEPVPVAVLFRVKVWLGDSDVVKVWVLVGEERPAMSRVPQKANRSWN